MVALTRHVTKLATEEIRPLLAAVRLKSSCTRPRFGRFADVLPRTGLAADDMRTLRSELDERLDDLVETVAHTVGQRIDLLEEEMGGLREEVRSEIGGLRRSIHVIHLLLIAVMVALVGLSTTVLVELL